MPAPPHYAAHYEFVVELVLNQNIFTRHYGVCREAGQIEPYGSTFPYNRFVYPKSRLFTIAMAMLGLLNSVYKRLFKGLPVLVAIVGAGHTCAEPHAEPLLINAEQKQTLLEKTEVLANQIEHHQELIAVKPEDSENYRLGFEDGYNRAIVDLIKSKLLNDPSISPKPRGSGLRQATFAQPPLTQPRSQQLYRHPQSSVATMGLEGVPAARNPEATAAVGDNPLGTREARRSGASTPVETDNAGDTNSVSSPVAAENAAVESSAVNDVSVGATVVIPAITPGPGEIVTISTGTIADSASDVTNATNATNATNTTNATNVAGTTLDTAGSAPSETVSTVTISTEISPSASENAAQSWLQKSNDFLAQKDWQQAIKAASEAIALQDDIAESYVVRSWAYAETGQSQRALDDIGTAIQIDPQNALAYNNRGYVNELIEVPDKAQVDYQKACALHYQPACETAAKLAELLEQQRSSKISELSQLSYHQFQQNQWVKVIDTTSQLLRLDPENTVALVNRAGAYTELGEYQKALDDCNNALIIDPNMAVAYNNKGYALELMGKSHKAALEYETACVLGVQQSCHDFKRLSNTNNSGTNNTGTNSSPVL